MTFEVDVRRAQQFHALLRGTGVLESNGLFQLGALEALWSFASQQVSASGCGKGVVSFYGRGIQDARQESHQTGSLQFAHRSGFLESSI